MRKPGMAWKPFINVVSKSEVRDSPIEEDTVLEHGECAAKANGETLDVFPNRGPAPRTHGVAGLCCCDSNHLFLLFLLYCPAASKSVEGNETVCGGHGSSKR
jgi:hypothetical protein